MADLDSPDDTLPIPEGPGLFGDAATPAPSSRQASYRVLARAYRPTRFEDLIGQEAMVRILRRAFATGRIAHAFMLTGVRGTGKTTTARIIARCLNCTGPDGAGGPTAEPCGVCSNCRAIIADRHPDVIEMDAASNTGVDDVREIIEATRFRPMEARTKVFIIDEVHMLSRNAFNALLKTLEEPPPHVKFVFATTELRKVPVTVLSRCQKFDLRRVPAAELAAHFTRIAEIERVAVSPEAIALIARAADGSVRDGLSLLDQAIAMGPGDDGATVSADAVADMLGLADRGLVLDLMEGVMGGQPAAALAALDQAHERGADAGLVLQDMLALAHVLSRLKASPDLRQSPDLPEAERSRGAALADRLSIPILGRAWQMLLRGVQEVEAAPDRRAATEMVLIRLCYLADQPPPGELVRRLTSGEPSAPRLPAPAAAPSPTPVAVATAVAAPPFAVEPTRVEQPRADTPRAFASYGNTKTQAAMAPAPQPLAEAPPPETPSPDAPPALPASFRDVVMLVRDLKEVRLYGHLLHSVHLVRFAPPVIELRPQPEAPRDLASKLAALLGEATGTRWTIALSAAPGDPTIDEQRQTAEQSLLAEAGEHPLVRAILTSFPGAKLQAVRDPLAEEFPAPPAPVMPAAEAGLEMPPDMPDFAPPEAELVGSMNPDLDYEAEMALEEDR
ncbi:MULTISPECIES: DNA polymerase III subunit gamma/tau [unclassified Acidisoma]|uniref:DNA polymerase III subunit gamma/tau n=1 Tax=unclassified Acidisoma TaxID=2634065 RepID=UPI00131DF3E6